jgi:hypothetical protein
MPVIFQCKNILRNSKKAWFIMLFSLLFLDITAQKGGKINAEDKKEYIQNKQRKAAEASQVAAKKHFYNIQTKKVQKRMREEDRNTKKYYNKKLGRSFFKMMFGKKKRN